jgi:hypothetical protein
MTPRSDAFLLEIEREFPRFRVVAKRGSRLSRAIDVALKIVTLGAQREFLTRYHTVIGDTLYVPASWDDAPDVARLITLRHERVHLRQRRRYGDALMAFLYLVPFLPLGLAYGRARLEWEAYQETMRAVHELRGPAALASPELRAYIVAQFTGGAYGWMWPFPRVVGRWFDRAAAAIQAAVA